MPDVRIVNSRNRNDRRLPAQPGFALLLTVLLLSLLAAVLARFTLASGVTTIVAARHNGQLIHRLAVDSAIALANRELSRDGNWARQLDRQSVVAFALDVGPCYVELRLRDDGAKFDVAAFAQERQQRSLETKLKTLERALRLPRLRARLQPIDSSASSSLRRYVWFDQLFDAPYAHRIFTVTDTARHPPRWSDAVTLFGDGRLDLRRAESEVIDTMLGDLVPGLGRQLPPVAQRNARNARGLLTDVLADLDERTAKALLARVTWDVGRYALGLRTAIRSRDGRESDVRRWYVVATLGQTEPIVHYRGLIRW